MTAGYILPLCTLKPKERSGSWEISTRQQQCVPILSQQQQQCPSVRSLRQIKPMRAAMSCPSKGTKSSDITYDRVWNRNFFFEILPFCQLNEEYQQRENSKQCYYFMATEMCLSVAKKKRTFNTTYLGLLFYF